MRLHFYEKEERYKPEFISEGEFHFIKKINPTQKKKTKSFLLKR